MSLNQFKAATALGVSRMIPQGGTNKIKLSVRWNTSTYRDEHNPSYPFILGHLQELGVKLHL